MPTLNGYIIAELTPWKLVNTRADTELAGEERTTLWYEGEEGERLKLEVPTRRPDRDQHWGNVTGVKVELDGVGHGPTLFQNADTATLGQLLGRIQVCLHGHRGGCLKGFTVLNHDSVCQLRAGHLGECVTGALAKLEAAKRGHDIDTIRARFRAPPR